MSDSATLFSDLSGLTPAMLSNLTQLGFTEATEIQSASLPVSLAGKDLLAQAKTGSGKTLAFGIPVLQKLNPRFYGVQGLILCPTRELATQVAEELRRLARFQPNLKISVICGGVSIGPQIASLERGAHIIVGTPGRIKDHLRKQTLTLDEVNTLVLDEADRMLEMGFADDIRHIAGHTRKDRQTLLFSATYPDNIQSLSHDLMHNPEFIQVESVHNTAHIHQYLIPFSGNSRDQTLLQAMQHFAVEQAVVFCNTKQSVNDVTRVLRDAGYLALGLHGDLQQKERDQIYIRFKQGSAHCLIATDVAARGLDVDDLQAVINYELPRDPEVYVHRIGRSGRAGKEGLAISLISDKEDYRRSAVEEQTGQALNLVAPQEMTGRHTPARPPYVSLCFSEGRKNKLRPGDIVGAITADGRIPGTAIGNITVLDFVAYAAVSREFANEALRLLEKSRIKGRQIRVRRV
ncbi:MAG: ATP-dependent RNA helicase DbpA [Oceanospirillaceae bacterium]|nr:ATP-dependent RNA helicase DbpA [Oceanospirillaceae bacterium]|tara:strand:- start:101755 stop:103140 length:1386 start_codon:yes stop_codon:yes gene_type:complete